jgi:hypothetical protein
MQFPDCTPALDQVMQEITASGMRAASSWM